MRKVKAYIAMSVDGYVASKEGGVDWLIGDGSQPDHLGSYSSFMETIDTVILGSTTYHQIINELAVDDWPYANQKSYVFTTKKLTSKEDITFVNEDVVSVMERIKQEEGKDIWLCGGASIIQQCHAAGIIDEYTLSIIPMVLGAGIRLFDTTSTQTPLQLITTRHYNGIVDVVYKKR